MYLLVSSLEYKQRWTDPMRSTAVTSSFLERIKSNIGLTSQSNKCVSRKQFSERTCYARPNPDSGKRRCSSSQHSNKSSQCLVNVQSWLCATLVSLPTRSRTSMLGLRSTCQRSRRRSSTVVPLCRRTSRSSQIKIPTPISLSLRQAA